MNCCVSLVAIVIYLFIYLFIAAVKDSFESDRPINIPGSEYVVIYYYYGVSD